jgi:hypothetical protein
MTKFFRRIRQLLLSERRFGKYLPYAIGEITLVVIGILVALQINNWNQNRIENGIELELLIACQEGLEKDLSDANFNMNSHTEGIKAANYVIAALASSDAYNIDTIARKMSDAMMPTLFVHSTSAFEAIKSKGVNIISNGDLRNKIIEVYDSMYRFFLSSEQNYYDNIEYGIKTILPSRFEEAYNNDLQKPGLPGSIMPLNFEALKSDQEFFFYLKTLRNRAHILLEFHYAQLQADITNLINELEQEIKLIEAQ